jgi:hypothetical protein
VQNEFVAPPPEALGVLARFRRIQTMMICISAIVVLGCSIAATALSRYGGIQIVLVGAAIGGFCWLIVAVDGMILRRRAMRLAQGLSQSMDMKTDLFPSMKSIVSGRVLVTLAAMGARSDPEVTFKARWFTPGIAEAPPGIAQVYRGPDGRSVVFAVTERGGVLGRPRRTSRHP